MRLVVDGGVFARFPGVRIGLVVARGCENRTLTPEIETALRVAEREAAARAAVRGEAPITELPDIAAWRTAYRAFGAQPRDYRCSIEALLRRVGQGKELPAVNPLVAIYNTVSLRHYLPVGGEDMDRVSGDIELRFAGADEPSVQLLGQDGPSRPFEGEVFYTDAAGALCRCWNWREAARTCLREETTNAVLVMEALGHRSDADLDAALADLVARLEVVGGNIGSWVVDASRPGVVLDV